MDRTRRSPVRVRPRRSTSGAIRGERVLHILVERRSLAALEGARRVGGRLQFVKEPLVAAPLRVTQAGAGRLLESVNAAPQAGGEVSPVLLGSDGGEAGEAVRDARIVLQADTDLEALAVEAGGPVEIVCLEREVAEAVEPAGEVPGDLQPSRDRKRLLEQPPTLSEIACLLRRRKPEQRMSVCALVPDLTEEDESLLEAPQVKQRVRDFTLVSI